MYAVFPAAESNSIAIRESDWTYQEDEVSALKRSVSVPVLLGLLTYFVLGQQLGIASSFQDGTDGEYVDLCHVYAVDIGLAEEALQELAQLPGNPSEEQQREFAEKFAGAERNFGEFSTEVGEEEVTNRLYPWSEDGPYVVASVGYTDEMMASRNHYDCDDSRDSGHSSSCRHSGRG